MNETQQAKPQDDRPVKTPTYLVYDMNQRGDVPRMHDARIKTNEDGSLEVMSYKLYSDQSKGCPMPQDHAYQFLCDPQFKVVGPNGNRLMPTEKFDPGKPLTELKDDEIVVKYIELSREALFRRVKLIPGSENVRPNATVEELSAFLIGWRKKLAGLTDGDRRLAEMMASGKVDTMSGSEMDKLFGEREAA